LEHQRLQIWPKVIQFLDEPPTIITFYAWFYPLIWAAATVYVYVQYRGGSKAQYILTVESLFIAPLLVMLCSRWFRRRIGYILLAWFAHYFAFTFISGAISVPFNAVFENPFYPWNHVEAYNNEHFKRP